MCGKKLHILSSVYCNWLFSVCVNYVMNNSNGYIVMCYVCWWSCWCHCALISLLIHTLWVAVDGMMCLVCTTLSWSDMSCQQWLCVEWLECPTLCCWRWTAGDDQVLGSQVWVKGAWQGWEWPHHAALGSNEWPPWCCTLCHWGLQAGSSGQRQGGLIRAQTSGKVCVMARKDITSTGCWRICFISTSLLSANLLAGCQHVCKVPTELWGIHPFIEAHMYCISHASFSKVELVQQTSDGYVLCILWYAFIYGILF